MDFDTEPTLKDFNYFYTKYVEDIGLNKENEFIAAHKIVGTIRIEVENSEDEFEISGIEMDQLMGCGCPSGIVIKLIYK